ncbi:unnamed protein product [Nippostrongylus brasiliensis]|uniref:Amino acid transporter n=1 Tax=Nippostrongylus brasiliensis TaxID=27835 RepID=A0A0N4Y240_NIPBR|nr:unnamed protein product [Nippostrongylus brasiliensis]
MSSTSMAIQRFCRDNTLLVMTIVSVVLGVSLGFGLRPLNLSAETLQLINFPGEIFMQVLKMMILPLIFSSLISALAQMDAKESGQMGLATVLYYLTTTVLATLLGIFLVMTIHPGDPSIKAGSLPDVPVDTEVSPLDTFLDLVRFAPLGITCLVCGNLLELDDLSDTASVLLLYVFTVIAGLLLHTVITCPILYFLITRKNPMFIVRGMMQAIVTAFGTASGGAALPMSMQCMEDNCHLNNVDLSFAEVLTVSVTATIASIGLGSVPAGLVSILLILNTVGLPIKDVSLLLTVDWLLDRVRTSINVLGDGFAAGVVAHILQSAANSRKPSFTWSEHSKEVYFNAMATNANSRIQSRSGSIANFNLSWRNALLEPGYAPLNKVQDV